TYRQRTALLHGADGVLAKIPEDLLHAIAIGENHGLRSSIFSLDSDSNFLHFETALQQREGVLEQRHHVNLRKAILLGMRIGEEVGDDVVEPLRFPGDYLQKPAMLLIQAGNLRKQSG